MENRVNSWNNWAGGEETTLDVYNATEWQVLYFSETTGFLVDAFNNKENCFLMHISHLNQFFTYYLLYIYIFFCESQI
jgi:hypothetical protein